MTSNTSCHCSSCYDQQNIKNKTNTHKTSGLNNKLKKAEAFLCQITDQSFTTGFRGGKNPLKLLSSAQFSKFLSKTRPSTNPNMNGMPSTKVFAIVESQSRQHSLSD